MTSCLEATHAACTRITSFCAEILDNYRKEKDTNSISKVSYRIFHMKITGMHVDIAVLCPVILCCVTFQIPMHTTVHAAISSKWSSD
jgi:hypothetical protein